MIYVMSDIHGCYEKYREMLNLIDFSKNDTMYILGDVFDRGGKSIDVLKDMMQHDNIIPIIGNHDYTVYNCIKELIEKTKNEVIDKEKLYSMPSIKYWIRHGGEPSIEELKFCTADDIESILKYMETFLLSKEIVVGGTRFILVHAGLEKFDEEKPLSHYTLEEVCLEVFDYSKQYFSDGTCIVTGHMPTYQIDEKYRGRIYHNKNNIAIDCGAAYGEKLACLCLDNMKEYYV